VPFYFGFILSDLKPALRNAAFPKYAAYLTVSVFMRNKNDDTNNIDKQNVDNGEEEQPQDLTSKEEELLKRKAPQPRIEA